MTLTTREKADRYDALVFAIGQQKAEYEKKAKNLEKEIENTQDNIAGLLIGRKYAYIEFAEELGRWC